MHKTKFFIALIAFCSLYNAQANIKNYNCKRFEGAAFIKPGDDGILGNGAVTFACQEMPSYKTMKDVAYAENKPITTFIKHIKDNEFNIRYFLPDGAEVNICGHGTIFTNAVIAKAYNIQGDIIYIPNLSLFKGGKIVGNIDIHGRSSILLPLGAIENVDHATVKIAKSMIKKFGGDDNSIIDIKKCPTTGDVLISLNDAKMLRSLNANHDILKAMERLGYRLTIITARAIEAKSYDYETRLFFSSLNGDEDIACGSANIAAAAYWRQKLSRSNLRILYPYHFNDTGKMGGTQEVVIFAENKNIVLSGFITIN